MSENTVLQAEIREGSGKSVARQLRREGRIPAVVYGNNKAEAKISLLQKDVIMAYHKGGFKSQVVELDMGKEKIKVLPREVQLHPVTDIPLHADFLHVNDDTPVIVGVKIDFINREKSPGLKRGGILNIVRRRVDLLCTAGNIPASLTADLTGKQIKDSIHISAVQLPEGVEPVIKDRDFTIATIAGRISQETREDAGAEGSETTGEGGEEEAGEGGE